MLLGVAVAGAPGLTYAQHGFGGGGGHFGGGHVGGGATGHVSGGHALSHFGGGGHSFAAPHFSGGGHSFAAPHFSGGHSAAYGAAHSYAGAHFAGHGPVLGAPRAGSAYVAGGWYGGGHYWYGGHYWHGGYWGGVFWPHVWFYPGWAWFLPVLPWGYATFWWGGVPYYYYNSLYYTWSPYYNGYVVSDPPPAADDSSAETSGDAGAAQYNQAAPAPYSAGGQSRGAADVYLYPRNGQSDTQAQNDRYECHSWAVNQTGFDPTRPAQQSSGSAADYRRAMIACLDARGYSAR